MEYDKGIDSEEESIIIKAILCTFQHDIFRANSNFFTAYLILYQLTKKNPLWMFRFFNGAGELLLWSMRKMLEAIRRDSAKTAIMKRVP